MELIYLLIEVGQNILHVALMSLEKYGLKLNLLGERV